MRNNKYLSGSLTIELTFIMPLILSVIILILFLGYFTHDKCILENGVYLCALNAAGEITESKLYDIRSISSNYYSDIYIDTASMRRRLIGDWDITENAICKDNKVIVNINGSMNCFDAFGLHIISSKLFSVDISESVPCIYEKYYLRK